MVEKQCQLGPDRQAAVGSKQTLLGNRNTFMRFFSVDRPFVEPGQTQIDPSISPFRGRFLLSGTRLALAALAVAFVIQPDRSPASAEESTSAAQVLAAQVFDMSVPTYPECAGGNVHKAGKPRERIERIINTFIKVVPPDNPAALAAAKDPQSSVNIKITAEASSSGSQHFIQIKKGEENIVIDQPVILSNKSNTYSSSAIVMEIEARNVVRTGYQNLEERTLGIILYADAELQDRVGTVSFGNIFILPSSNFTNEKAVSKPSVEDLIHEETHSKFGYSGHSKYPNSYIYAISTTGPELKVPGPDVISQICGNAIWTTGIPFAAANLQGPPKK